MADLLQKWFWRVFNPDTHHMGLVASYKCSANLFLYSPDCSVIRKWELYGVFPTNLTFGELSAEQQGTPMSIQMELAVDKTSLSGFKSLLMSRCRCVLGLIYLASSH